MTNRFDTIVPIRSTFMPKNFMPNFEAYQGLLEQEQTNFNTMNAMQDIPIDALQGADEEYAKQLRSNLSGEIDNITELYKGDINEARRKGRDFIRQTKKRTLPGGDIRELALRKKQYTDFATEQKARMEKGEITSESYWNSVAEAKRKYDTAGGYGKDVNLSLNSRTKAVNIDEFAKDFLKNFTADSGMSISDFRYEPQTGKIYYDKSKVTELQAQKVQRSLTAAYKNAASQTGQLDDLYDYRNSTGQVGITDNRADAQAVIQQINSLDLNDETQATKAQELLNTLGSTLKTDGNAGSETQQALQQAEELASMTDQQFNQAVKSGYIDSYINSLAAPYSDAKSFVQRERDLEFAGRTLDAEIGLHRRKKQIDDAGFMFTGNSISMNMGAFIKDGAKGISEAISTQNHTIQQLTLERDKALGSGNINSQQEVSFIENKIRWEEGKLQQMTDLRNNEYQKAVEKFSPETQELIKHINNLEDSLFLDAQMGSATANAAYRRNKASEIAEKLGTTQQKVLEGLETMDNLANIVDKNLENITGKNQQISLGVTSGLPKDVTTAIEAQLQTMAFDFYDENGPLENVNQTNWFNIEKEGTKPVSGKIKVRGISKSAFGPNGHLITLENTETGDIIYASPINSNLSYKVGQELVDHSDPEIARAGFMMMNGTKITSQVSDLRDGIQSPIIVGNENKISIPVTRVDKAYGKAYQIEIPQGMEGAKGILTVTSDSALEDALYKISQYGNGSN